MSINRTKIAVVALAAGAGQRMRSTLPKPLHPIAGMPMIQHVLRAAAASSPVSTTVVVSPGNEASIRRALSSEIRIAIQQEPRGTADAVRSALPHVDRADLILVLFTDHPLLTSSTVTSLVDAARVNGARVTALTCVVDDIAGYGRIDRDDRGRLRAVIERNDDDPALRSGGGEINSGMMVIEAQWARTAFSRIEPSSVTGEFYLPELVRLAAEEAIEGAPWPAATAPGRLDELLGVNNRVELAEAEAILRDRVRREKMLAGVTLVSPETIVIDVGVEIGADTTILPFTMLQAGTTIGVDCEIGPNSTLRNATIGDGVRVTASTVVDSVMEPGTDVGPYSHLRGGAIMRAGAHVGNFTEIKNSVLGAGARAGHFSYIGDASIGDRSNIGAGTVTCNYDGVDKHRTDIGADVFIGSGSMLIAPLTIGDHARTGAGSVVNHDVAAGTTVVGVPARPIRSRTPERDKG